jgi:integrase/recombinase XerD
MERIPPKRLARRLAKLIKRQRPDENYLKKTFEHVRDLLDIHRTSKSAKKLPELLTEEEIKRFYETVWNSANRTHLIMIKLLLYTGIRNSELVNLTLDDIDLNSLRARINSGKGNKDRYVLIPPNFRGELAQYIATQKENKAHYLFESNRLDQFTTRWIREIVRKYAQKAGITKRIYPHLFRHQLLTYLTKHGIVDAKIQLISGHSDRASLAIYQDLSLVDIEKEYQQAMKSFPVQ